MKKHNIEKPRNSELLSIKKMATKLALKSHTMNFEPTVSV